MSRKKKIKQPKLDPKMDQAVKAAYKLGLMDREERILRKIREGSCN